MIAAAAGVVAESRGRARAQGLAAMRHGISLAAGHVPPVTGARPPRMFLGTRSLLRADSASTWLVGVGDDGGGGASFGGACSTPRRQWCRRRDLLVGLGDRNAQASPVQSFASASFIDPGVAS